MLLSVRDLLPAASGSHTSSMDYPNHQTKWWDILPTFVRPSSKTVNDGEAKQAILVPGAMDGTFVRLMLHDDQIVSWDDELLLITDDLHLDEISLPSSQAPEAASDTNTARSRFTLPKLNELSSFDMEADAESSIFHKQNSAAILMQTFWRSHKLSRLRPAKKVVLIIGLQPGSGELLLALDARLGSGSEVFILTRAEEELRNQELDALDLHNVTKLVVKSGDTALERGIKQLPIMRADMAIVGCDLYGSAEAAKRAGDAQVVISTVKLANMHAAGISNSLRRRSLHIIMQTMEPVSHQNFERKTVLADHELPPLIFQRSLIDYSALSLSANDTLVWQVMCQLLQPEGHIQLRSVQVSTLISKIAKYSWARAGTFHHKSFDSMAKIALKEMDAVLIGYQHITRLGPEGSDKGERTRKGRRCIFEGTRSIADSLTNHSRKDSNSISMEHSKMDTYMEPVSLGFGTVVINPPDREASMEWKLEDRLILICQT